VITEGVFGMNGNQGKVKELVALKEKYDFRLFVDDAHGFGTMGKTGGGIGEEQDCTDGIDLYFSTFAKSLAGVGGFIAADKDVLYFLRYNMRSQIFAKSLPMAMVVGGLKRMELIRTMPELREKLWDNVNKLQQGLKERGFNIGTTNTPVTPVYMEGELHPALQMIVDLRENYNIFCSVVVYPVIPKGQIILRLIPTAVHTDEDIKQTLEAFSIVSEKLKNGEYPDVFPDIKDLMVHKTDTQVG
jgi:glycine C-acetyltransferase